MAVARSGRHGSSRVLGNDRSAWRSRNRGLGNRLGGDRCDAAWRWWCGDAGRGGVAGGAVWAAVPAAWLPSACLPGADGVRSVPVRCVGPVPVRCARRSSLTRVSHLCCPLWPALCRHLTCPLGSALASPYAACAFPRG
uniref:Uncharacterized protein n=1 Tax=Nonomuraea gerenzanensis TaxID=93944 RepID=A0A1M4EDU0_9ACTN|nr:hypothetical protein BN4615_P6601 [Nonomuraea gerenzanensis]